MCGRYTLKSELDALEQALGCAPDEPLIPRYNIAPTQNVCVMRQGESGIGFADLRWGLIPHWAKDKSVGSRMINARSETIAIKPSFKVPFRRRPCLLVADGYYEWRKDQDGRQPFYISRPDGLPFAFAGIWDRWHTAEMTIESCAIITCAANDAMKSLHARMPVIIEQDAFAAWLAPDEPVSVREQLLKSPSDDYFSFAAVSKHVNSPRNEGAQCIASVTI
ncbi:MAG: SOS response-associated peptidase [Pseudomonadota bacterium]